MCNTTNININIFQKAFINMAARAMETRAHFLDKRINVEPDWLPRNLEAGLNRKLVHEAGLYPTSIYNEWRAGLTERFHYPAAYNERRRRAATS